MTDQNTQVDKEYNDDVLNTDGQETREATSRRNFMRSKAEAEVRENEVASLQDNTYAFDSENTGNEDIHDVSDFESESYEGEGEDLQ